MDKQRVLVIIPAYNEEKSIGEVIRKLKISTGADIIVINDGSKDSTKEEALKMDVRVVTLPFNLGIGGAMQAGYIYAKENDYDVAIQVDGDGQHDPAYVNSLVDKLNEDKCDMVIGSRYVEETQYKSSASRRAGMIIFSGMVHLLTGKTIKDTTSGFRAVNRRVIEYFALNYPRDYPEVDVLVRLHKKGYKVCEMPVRMLNRQGGKSSITPAKSIYYMIKVSMALLINSLRSGEAS